ncbi:hypothetical protein TESG_08269 [Trichophyton tonsurans CBS 112818]|uniref:Uncharacterized protein n=2 Tax=Trichophyton TaxID=5550 RepID=F2PN50_TRIEC|nr:hypothetical protein TESG_08269 [Trichophyton tonsurans CBS 112818]EGE03318.1 hypothetical protein TEQG_08627 [Trichophyton equinum CBS 127.97]
MDFPTRHDPSSTHLQEKEIMENEEPQRIGPESASKEYGESRGSPPPPLNYQEYERGADQPAAARKIKGGRPSSDAM